MAIGSDTGIRVRDFAEVRLDSCSPEHFFPEEDMVPGSIFALSEHRTFGAFGGGNQGTIPVTCERAGKAHVKIRTTSNEIIHIHIDAYVSKVRLLSWLKLRKDLAERWLVSLTDTGSMTVLELTDGPF